MKVQLLQENLNQALSLTTRIIKGKSQLPILSNILLKAQKTNLSLSATDLELSLVIQLPAKIEKEGEITLPAKTFQELIFSLPPKKITLEQVKEELEINCERISGKIRGVGAKEFPTIPSVKKEVGGWRVKGVDFVKACSQVVYAASFDEARPVLAGVRLDAQEGQSELVATDGYRLSQKYLEGKFEKGKTLIVPAKALLEVSRIIGQDEEEVRLIVDKKQNQIIFLFKNVQIVARLIEGQFPPFVKVIPKNWQTEIVVDRAELVRALKVAAVFARESANIVRFKIEDSRLKISANAPQLGENESEIEAKIKGEDAEIAFNFRFVLEFLNSIEGERVNIKLRGSLSPAIFEQTGDKSLLHVIMPVRVQKQAE